MRLGLVLRNSGPDATDAVRRIPDLATELGYDAVWASDHVLSPPSFAARYGVEWLDPFIALAAVVDRAPAVTLGFSVLVAPYRPPLQTAKALASLQALSKGRVVCGVGSGWLEEEFDALGVSFADRAALTDATLVVLRGAAQRDDFAPKESVPLLAGGNGPAALRRAAFVGGWHPIALTPGEVAGSLRHLPAGTRVALRTRLGLGRDRRERPLFGTDAEVAADLSAYARAGVTDLVVDYAAQDIDEVEHQVRRLATVKEEVAAWAS
jgi:alkanesulfonate monooxygenase SsuD/methylene tetrahydromethanopterin reductase-like flavin-dependent oxidoreductase (luciferase family)